MDTLKLGASFVGLGAIVMLIELALTFGFLWVLWTYLIDPYVLPRIAMLFF